MKTKFTVTKQEAEIIVADSLRNKLNECTGFTVYPENIEVFIEDIEPKHLVCVRKDYNVKVEIIKLVREAQKQLHDNLASKGFIAPENNHGIWGLAEAKQAVEQVFKWNDQ